MQLFEYFKDPIGWFYLYSIISTIVLTWWLLVGGYKASIEIAERQALTEAWQQHFKENVAGSWIFNDGVGG